MGTQEIFLRIAIMLMSQHGTNAFSIPEFFAQGGREILINIGAQVVGYGFGVLTDRPIEPMKFLPPVISYAPQTYDFITNVTGGTRAERVATLALLLSGTGSVVKTGDTVVNVGAGAFLYVLFDYIDTIAKSGGGGSTPFIISRPNRKLRKFTTKQHIQCQLAIVAIPILIAGCSYVIFIVTKKLIKRCKKLKSTVKNFRFKPRQRRTKFVEWIKMKRFLSIFKRNSM